MRVTFPLSAPFPARSQADEATQGAAVIVLGSKEFVLEVPSQAERGAEVEMKDAFSAAAKLLLLLLLFIRACINVFHVRACYS